MLKNLEINASEIIGDIIRTKQKGDTLIVLEDIQNIIMKDKDKITNVVVDPEIIYDDTNYHPSHSDEHVYRVISDPTSKINTIDGVEGYTALFRSRFEKLLHILALRPSSKRITRIASLKQTARSKSHSTTEYRTTNSVSVVAGLLMSKHFRKNGLEMVIDDYTGILNVIATNEELRKQASILALDQMVMLELENQNNKAMHSFVIKNIVSPDIPEHLPTRSKSETLSTYLISDLHVGSKYFMEKEFIKFLMWLSSDADDIVRRIKFLCIAGDLIDGIGIFPHQDKELLETNTDKQIIHVIDLLTKIPKHIKVFVIPGNHDPGRRALPQPAIPRNDSNKLYSLNNFTMLGNPSLIELNGVKILMYHGQGLDDIIAATPGLTYSKPAEAMKILLKARHLSPIYGEHTPIDSGKGRYDGNY